MLRLGRRWASRWPRRLRKVSRRWSSWGGCVAAFLEPGPQRFPYGVVAAGADSGEVAAGPVADVVAGVQAAGQVEARADQVLASLPETARLTLTWDQGSEMALHDQIVLLFARASSSRTAPARGSAAPTKTRTGCPASTSRRHRPAHHTADDLQLSSSCRTPARIHSNGTSGRPARCSPRPHRVGDLGPDGQHESPCEGLRARASGRDLRNLVPAAARTVPDESVYCPARSRTRNMEVRGAERRAVAISGGPGCAPVVAGGKFRLEPEIYQACGINF